MLEPISKITKELKIKSHQLHEWEKRGWLGTEPVLKDPNKNGQRIYNEEQVKRIYFIHQEVEKQREAGIKRTDFDDMKEKLLDQFGGEVIKKENSVAIPDDSLQAVVEMFRIQNKKIEDLEAIVREQAQKELPEPVDHTPYIKELEKEVQELRNAQKDDWITRKRLERKLREEAVALWNEKADSEKMMTVALFWKMEDKVKRDDFIQDYIDEHLVERYEDEMGE